MDYSLQIIFPRSRSKNYWKAIKLARKFDSFREMEQNTVNVSMKELFEKWEYFNLLFWCVVDWKGSVLEWEGMSFHSHCDKTRIFYGLQHAHVSYICYLEARIQKLYQVELGQIKYDELDQVYSEEDMNALLDSFKILKNFREIEDDHAFNDIKVRRQQRFLRNINDNQDG